MVKNLHGPNAQVDTFFSWSHHRESHHRFIDPPTSCEIRMGGWVYMASFKWKVFIAEIHQGAKNDHQTIYTNIYIYMCMFIDFFQLHFESKKPVWKQKVPISSPLCGNLPIKNRPGIWSSHPNGHKSPCRNRSRPITPAGPSWARLQWPCTGPWPNEQPSPWWCWDMIVTKWNTKKTVHFYSKGCLVFNSWFFWRPFYIKLCW